MLFEFQLLYSKLVGNLALRFFFFFLLNIEAMKAIVRGNYVNCTDKIDCESKLAINHAGNFILILLQFFNEFK